MERQAKPVVPAPKEREAPRGNLPRMKPKGVKTRIGQ